MENPCLAELQNRDPEERRTTMDGRALLTRSHITSEDVSLYEEEEDFSPRMQRNATADPDIIESGGWDA